jgi:hypothetical protein
MSVVIFIERYSSDDRKVRGRPTIYTLNAPVARDDDRAMTPRQIPLEESSATAIVEEPWYCRPLVACKAPIRAYRRVSEPRTDSYDASLTEGKSSP